MQKVFLLHKGLKLTAKSIQVITEAVKQLPKNARKFEIVDSLADASLVVVGDDIYPKKDLLTADETEGLPVYPSSNLVNAIKNKLRIMSPSEYEEWERTKEAERAALAALPHAEDPACSASGPIRHLDGASFSTMEGPYDRPASATSARTEIPIETEEILAMLSEFKELYEIQGDSFRAKGYVVAYEWLISYPDSDLLTVEHIAPSVKEKIRELRRTGKCQKLEALRKCDIHLDWKRELMLIHGVGPVIADKWARKYKIKSIDQLRKTVEIGSIKLTEGQTIGLKYYEDLKKRIPRAEVEEMAEVVRSAAVDDLGWRVEIVICGSYRRGQETCGDADIIIFSQADDKAANLGIKPLINLLKEKGFLLETLQLSDGGGGGSAQSYLGVAKGNQNIVRRIDIKLYPITAKPFALIQWSGGEFFVRAMKIRASSLGYKLTDSGLFPVAPGTREIIGPSVQARTEKEVFDLLQVPYDAQNPWNQTAVGFGLQAMLKR